MALSFLILVDYQPPIAGTRPGRRDTFLLRGKKVPKESRPALPALRAALAAKGSPGRQLNSLRSDNASGLLPATLPRSAAQRGHSSVRFWESTVRVRREQRRSNQLSQHYVFTEELHGRSFSHLCLFSKLLFVTYLPVTREHCVIALSSS